MREGNSERKTKERQNHENIENKFLLSTVAINRIFKRIRKQSESDHGFDKEINEYSSSSSQETNHHDNNAHCDSGLSEYLCASLSTSSSLFYFVSKSI